MQKNGFTIIELLIVIAVIGIMTGLVSLQLADADGNSRLRQAATVVRADMQSIIQSAQSGNTVTVVDVVTIPLAYGIELTPGSSTADYIVFADIDGNDRYDSGTDVTVRTQQFSGDAVLNRIDMDSCSPQLGNRCSITVRLANGEIRVNGTAGGTLQTILRQTDSGNTITIDTYASTGRIEIE